MTQDAVLILGAGALLIAGVLASLVATRLRLPALVLFLVVGMATGTDGLGWIDFADYRLARLIGSIALLLILFEAGLASGLPELRPVLVPAVSLAIVGTAVTALIAGLVASALFDFSLLEGLLVGAIVSGTDGAAVFALLRGAPLPRRLARTLAGEAGLNDPVAVLLVLAVIELIRRPDYGAADIALFFAQELGIGLAVGGLVGALAVWALRRLRSAAQSLSLVATFAVAAVAFGAAGALHGSSFLAVYVAGLIIGGADLPLKGSLVDFHEGLAAVAEMGMFLTLGLLVFPSRLDDVALPGTGLALVVAFVARPVAAFVATGYQGFTLGDRALLGWAGLRGAVPVVLATFPIIRDVPGAWSSSTSSSSPYSCQR